MRVVGYVRESPGPAEAEPAFAQAERIRRWAADTGHQLVSVCQDVRTPGRALGRDGYRALVGIVAAGEVDAVVLPDLTTLSADKIGQEVMLWDLRSRGVAVLSTEPADNEALLDPPNEQVRLIVRDVLAKVAVHLGVLSGDDQPPELGPGPEPDGEPEEEDEDGVIVELVPSESPDEDASSADSDDAGEVRSMT